MRLDELERGLRGLGDDVRGGSDAWEFGYRGVHMACFADSQFDRMRIISPIVETSALGPDELEAMLRANFHTALDGRYAISDDTVYAAYMHPLSHLTEEQLASAVDQIAHLVASFGEEFSSGALHYGPGRSDPN